VSVRKPVVFNNLLQDSVLQDIVKLDLEALTERAGGAKVQVE
jgi:hypothetical protein